MEAYKLIEIFFNRELPFDQFCSSSLILKEKGKAMWIRSSVSWGKWRNTVKQPHSTFNNRKIHLEDNSIPGSDDCWDCGAVTSADSCLCLTRLGNKTTESGSHWKVLHGAEVSVMTSFWWWAVCRAVAEWGQHCIRNKWASSWAFRRLGMWLRG